MFGIEKYLLPTKLYHMQILLSIILYFTNYKNYVEEYFGEWDDNVQIKMFADIMEKDAKRTYIITIDGKMVGFFSDGEDNEEGYHPNNLCLLPECRGKGIGSDILNKVLNKHKHKDILLRVFKSNPAQNLYKRMGFEIYDETKSHYLMIKKNNRK